MGHRQTASGRRRGGSPRRRPEGCSETRSNEHRRRIEGILHPIQRRRWIIQGEASATVEGGRRPRSRGGRFAAVFDLSRGRQAFLSIAQPGLGAVLALGALPSWRVAGLGLAAATAGFLAVFSLNDVLDRRVDAASLEAGKGEVSGYDIDTAFERHPLARGDLSLAFSLAWVCGLAIVGGVLAWILQPLCLALFAGAVALEVLYCRLRSVTLYKTIVSGVMVGLGGLAGWAATGSLSPRALTLFLFLALWEIGGRNIANDLADVESDSRVGIKTVATVHGPVAAARAACVVGFAALAATALLPMSGLLADVGLCFGLLVIAWPGAKLWHHPSSAEAASYFNWASLYPAVLLAIVVAPLLGAAI